MHMLKLIYFPGQFMVKGMAIDPIRKMLTYPDNHDPAVVEMDKLMTGKKCHESWPPRRRTYQRI